MRLELQDAGGSVVPYKGEDAPDFHFHLYAVWQSIGTVEEPLSARGGDSITIMGAGFDTEFMSYKCRFSNEYSSNYFITRGNESTFFAETDAVASNSTHITCFTPMWNFSASESGEVQDSDSGFVQVRLIGRDGIPVHFANSSCGLLLPYPWTSCFPPRIRIGEVWYSAVPMQAFSGGGAIVTVKGYGFTVGSDNNSYECRWRASNHQVNSFQDRHIVHDGRDDRHNDVVR